MVILVIGHTKIKYTTYLKNNSDGVNSTAFIKLISQGQTNRINIMLSAKYLVNVYLPNGTAML